ncbi:MAG TPA: ABC transporter ATP-binding protein [Bacilli bacterium]|nr:ABC transporter ATP-binding protein [Bacilli bacterium]
MNIGYLRKAFAYVWRCGKGWVLFSILAYLINGLLPLLTIWVSKEMINVVSAYLLQPSSDPTPVFRWLLLQFMIVLFGSALSNLQNYMNRRMEIRLDHDLHQMVSKKTTTAPLAYFDIPHFYHHINRVTAGVGTRFLSPVRSTLTVGKELITISSLLVYLFSVHWSLALLSLLAAVPIFLVQSKFGGQRFSLMMHQTPVAREANYISMLLKDRQTAKEIRLFNLGRYLIERWSGKFWQNADGQLKLSRRQQLTGVGLDGLTGLFFALAAGVIVWLTRSTRTIRIGDFIAIGQAVQSTQGSINNISTTFAKLFEESLYIRDFFQFLSYENPALEKPQGSEPFPVVLRHGISVENVSFRYPQEPRDALRNVSFTIRPGEKIAIVGENGSGKTTLVKLLMGLYPVSAGQICFDGLNLDQIAPDSLAKSITVIFQDFMRYSFSVHDNIALGDIERLDDRERVQEVGRLSSTDDFVKRLPDGYDTYLGRFLNEGTDLSGGQWQKIALARALFRDGEVIILDEPTAALDPQAEMDVFRHFDRLTAGKTAIFISHRMSAARMADRILVMKDGELVEVGSHDELVTLDGEYAEMYRLQAQWYN